MAQAGHGARIRLGELLLREGLISESQLERALDEQRSLGGRVGRHLVDLGFIDEDTLRASLSRQLGLPAVNLDAPGAVANDVARYARADLCEQWGFCPVAFDKTRGVLVIAVSDPDAQLQADIESLIRQRVEMCVAPADAIERAILRLYHGGGSEEPVRQMQGLQLARSAAKDAGGGRSDRLDFGPGPAGPPTMGGPTAPVPNPFDAQIAQQVALQHQLQQQLHQQLQMQQLQHLQMQARTGPQGYAPVPVPPPMSGMAAPPPAGYPPPQGYPVAAPAYGYAPQPAALPAQAAPAPPPPAPPQPPPARTSPPPSRAGPMLPQPQDVSVEALQEQVERLERLLRDHVGRLENTLAAQARALRSLVDVLVDRGVLTKADMARKQQEYGNR